MTTLLERIKSIFRETSDEKGWTITKKKLNSLTMGLGFSISFAGLLPLIFKLFIYGEMISIFVSFCCPFPMLNETLTFVVVIKMQL